MNCSSSSARLLVEFVPLDHWFNGPGSIGSLVRLDQWFNWIIGSIGSIGSFDLIGSLF